MANGNRDNANGVYNSAGVNVIYYKIGPTILKIDPFYVLYKPEGVTTQGTKLQHQMKVNFVICNTIP